jgi:FG-GAP-like repeat
MGAAGLRLLPGHRVDPPPDWDGHLDLAVAGFRPAGNVLVLLGSGDGGFQPAPGSPYQSFSSVVRDVQLADFDRDGNLDAAVTQENGAAVMLGDGRGGLAVGFGSPYSTSGDLPTSLTVADFDRDGTPDIAVANIFTRDVAVLLDPKNAAGFCDLERARLGDTAFRQKYGTDPNGANAYGRCVSQHPLA